MRKAMLAILAVIFAATALMATGCAGDTDADVASANLSKSAEQFEIVRRIVFFNGITDKYLLSIEGNCSIESGANTGVAKALEVTCKLGDGQYKKHFLGLSDNVSYFVEQLQTADVSVSHYRVIFKPSVIVPDIDVE